MKLLGFVLLALAAAGCSRISSEDRADIIDNCRDAGDYSRKECTCFIDAAVKALKDKDDLANWIRIASASSSRRGELMDDLSASERRRLERANEDAEDECVDEDDRDESPAGAPTPEYTYAPAPEPPAPTPDAAPAVDPAMPADPAMTPAPH